MGRLPQPVIALLLVAAVVGVWFATSGHESAEAPKAAGSVERPGRGEKAPRCDRILARGDAARFVSRLKAGETGCLRGGVHATARIVAIKAPGVLLRSYPGERATLVGRLWVKRGADGARVKNIDLDGRNPNRKPSPTVNADDVILRGNDITNHHTMICVSVNNYENEPPPRNVVIENNVIHDCGELPATNHHHGIYVANARGTIVRNNVIYGNADRGVQLYPDADNSVVTGNIIDGNGQGVIFGGGPSSSSDDNLVARNVITGSTIRWNVQSHWQGPVGSGNVARNNCVWTERDSYEGTPANSGIQPVMDGAQAFDNIVVNSRSADRAVERLRRGGRPPCNRPAD